VARPADMINTITIDIGEFGLVLLILCFVCGMMLAFCVKYRRGSGAASATQAAIVFILFMKLRGRPSLKWVFAAAGFFWLMFLFGLATVDYATRSGFPLK
jgi:hypothetical protein